MALDSSALWRPWMCVCVCAGMAALAEFEDFASALRACAAVRPRSPSTTGPTCRGGAAKVRSLSSMAATRVWARSSGPDTVHINMVSAMPDEMVLELHSEQIELRNWCRSRRRGRRPKKTTLKRKGPGSETLWAGFLPGRWVPLSALLLLGGRPELARSQRMRAANRDSPVSQYQVEPTIAEREPSWKWAQGGSWVDQLRGVGWGVWGGGRRGDEIELATQVQRCMHDGGGGESSLRRSWSVDKLAQMGHARTVDAGILAPGGGPIALPTATTSGSVQRPRKNC